MLNHNFGQWLTDLTIKSICSCLIAFCDIVQPPSADQVAHYTIKIFLVIYNNSEWLVMDPVVTVITMNTLFFSSVKPC